MSEMVERAAEAMRNIDFVALPTGRNTSQLAQDDRLTFARAALQAALDPEDEVLCRRIAEVISIGMEGIPLGDQPAKMNQGTLAVASDVIAALKAAAQGGSVE